MDTVLGVVPWDHTKRANRAAASPVRSGCRLSAMRSTTVAMQEVESAVVKIIRKYSMFSDVMNPYPAAIPAIAKALGDSTSTHHARTQRPIGRNIQQTLVGSGTTSVGRSEATRHSPRRTANSLATSSANPTMSAIGMSLNSTLRGRRALSSVASSTIAITIETMAPLRKNWIARASDRGIPSSWRFDTIV